MSQSSTSNLCVALSLLKSGRASCKASLQLFLCPHHYMRLSVQTFGLLPLVQGGRGGVQPPRRRPERVALPADKAGRGKQSAGGRARGALQRGGPAPGPQSLPGGLPTTFSMRTLESANFQCPD